MDSVHSAYSYNIGLHTHLHTKVCRLILSKLRILEIRLVSPAHFEAWLNVGQQGHPFHYRIVNPYLPYVDYVANATIIYTLSRQGSGL